MMETLKLLHSTIAYLRCGHGKPLVLLHGYPLDHRIWDSVVSSLENEFELIIPDLRGFGASTTIDANYSIADLADDVAKLIEEIGFQKVFLAGHSMGGYVSLAFARSHPDRLLGLGLVSSQSIADTPEKSESRYRSIKLLKESGLESISKSMVGKLTSEPNLQIKIHEIIMSQSDTGIRNALIALAKRPDQTATLSKLNIPLLIVHGDEDELIPLERAMADSKLAAHSSLVIIPKAGHVPMLEFPEETASALRWFVE